MITIRKSKDRGHFDYGWLDTYHTFSFSDYYDPAHMSFRHLRVINEDRVAPGEGFPTHPHRDMEIITYILEGELEHRDSIGNGSVIRPGDVQRMSAGTGVTHSEFNHSKTKPVHLLQIWILPEKRNLKPSYEQKSFKISERPNELILVASRNGGQGSVTVHQDVNLYTALLASRQSISYSLPPKRFAWIQIARGSITINDHHLIAGDGAAIQQEKDLSIVAKENSEFLLFDLS